MVTAKEIMTQWFDPKSDADVLARLDEHFGKPHAQADLDWSDLAVALRMQVAQLRAEATTNTMAMIAAQAQRIGQLEAEHESLKLEMERVGRRARRERRDLLERVRAGDQPIAEGDESPVPAKVSQAPPVAADTQAASSETMSAAQRMREAAHNPPRFVPAEGEGIDAVAPGGIAPVAASPIMSGLSERTRQLTDPAELYLDLVKNCLTRLLFGEQFLSIDPLTHQPMQFDADRRLVGSDWPAEAETMVGLRRLDNVQQCVVDVLRNGVPGDLVETGVWRGGVTILMRAVLKAYGDTERLVWAADSYEGLPVPDADKYSVDKGADFSTSAGFEILAVSLEQVQANFARYGLLDDQVRFLKGWFRDTLPTAPIEQISVLRLDGDLYESTTDALEALYPKLSVGGFIIIDDYLSWHQCRLAVDDYRGEHGIAEPIHSVDNDGAYWQRAR